MAYTVFDEIQNYTNIKEVYQFYTGYDLKKNGNDWTGLCPFHNDKNTGNFKIRKDKYFKCYTCNEYGSMIDLVGKLFDIAKKLDVVKKINSDLNLGLDLESFNATPNEARQKFMIEKERYELFKAWEKKTYHLMTEELHMIKRKLKEELLDDDDFAAYVLRLGNLDWWTDVFINHPSDSSKTYQDSELFALKEFFDRQGIFNS